MPTNTFNASTKHLIQVCKTTEYYQNYYTRN
jgi:hypothetical protein